MAASPFNAVKLDIVILGCAGVLLAAWLERSGIAAAVQLLVLAGYGIASALWAAMRVRRVLRSHAASAPDAADVSTRDIPSAHGQD